MEYSIVDVNSLKVKLILIMLALGFIYALLYLYLTTTIPYNLTIKKQKDIFFRRVLFFVGVFSLFSAEIFYVGDFLVNSWRARMNEDDLSTIVSSLMKFILPACAASLVVFVLTFWLCSKYLRTFFGYKPWTVFVSKGKKFGLF